MRRRALEVYAEPTALGRARLTAIGRAHGPCPSPPLSRASGGQRLRPLAEPTALELSPRCMYALPSPHGSEPSLRVLLEHSQ